VIWRIGCGHSSFATLKPATNGEKVDRFPGLLASPSGSEQPWVGAPETRNGSDRVPTVTREYRSISIERIVLIAREMRQPLPPAIDAGDLGGRIAQEAPASHRKVRKIREAPTAARVSQAAA
jgi:hypothetical protein